MIYFSLLQKLSKNLKIINEFNIFSLEKKNKIPSRYKIATYRGILLEKKEIRKRYTRLYTSFQKRGTAIQQRAEESNRTTDIRASTHSDIKTVLSLSLFRRRGCHRFLYRIHVSANFTSRYSSKPCHDKKPSLFFLG